MFKLWTWLYLKFCSNWKYKNKKEVLVFTIWQLTDVFCWRRHSQLYVRKYEILQCYNCKMYFDSSGCWICKRTTFTIFKLSNFVFLITPFKIVSNKQFYSCRYMLTSIILLNIANCRKSYCLCKLTVSVLVISQPTEIFWALH